MPIDPLMLAQDGICDMLDPYHIASNGLLSHFIEFEITVVVGGPQPGFSQTSKKKQEEEKIKYITIKITYEGNVIEKTYEVKSPKISKILLSFIDKTIIKMKVLVNMVPSITRFLPKIKIIKMRQNP